jgi:hypothetical protein
MKAADISKTGLIAKAAAKGTDAAGSKIIETGLRAVQTMATGTINSAVNAVTYSADGGWGFDSDGFKSGVASAAVSAGASVVQTITAGVLGSVNNSTVNTHEGFSAANKINAGDFANFVGGIAGEAVNYAYSGTFNLNVLRLKSGDIDTGLLELRLGKDGVTVNIGTGGADASLGTVAGVLREEQKHNLKMPSGKMRARQQNTGPPPLSADMAEHLDSLLGSVSGFLEKQNGDEGKDNETSAVSGNNTNLSDPYGVFLE